VRHGIINRRAGGDGMCAAAARRRSSKYKYSIDIARVNSIGSNASAGNSINNAQKNA